MSFPLSFLGGHGSYLAVALATHALIGFVLGAWLFGEPWAGMVGGLLADIDLLIPAAWWTLFAHRGVTHTPLAAGTAVGVTATFRRSAAGAVGVGYVSQLLIDITTPKGIPLVYPISKESLSIPIGGHSPEATVILWITGLVILWHHRSRSDDLVARDRSVDRRRT